MGKCFVIQPFDNGPYDKRYEDVLVPAIKAARLEPYRVDRDPHVVVPIEDIENGIRTSELCLADITTDNPNVWFEVGFAIASRKGIVLLCAETRPTSFPFDVRHRTILKYAADSPRDFLSLQTKITERLDALLQKQAEIQTIAALSPMKETEGLSHYEVAALIILMENKFMGNVTAYQLRDDMRSAGYTDVAISLSISSLLEKSMAAQVTEQDSFGNEYPAYTIAPAGVQWIMANQDQLVLKREPENNKLQKASITDEDIPF
jgi:hypothetical protein